jgi:hypothetical protein
MSAGTGESTPGPGRRVPAGGTRPESDATTLGPGHRLAVYGSLAPGEREYRRIVVTVETGARGPVRAQIYALASADSPERGRTP